ncbi:RNA-binding protein L-like isoform X1 [Phragmites australis]|uniref:RNA-binding protein L-like isoform X1 n=1 Tax=Phragmites australis TaxID=29695 RepID=UPI002D76FFD4|nr:RNA-binding protein L-like isoform X1 [Phragmites australis]
MMPQPQPGVAPPPQPAPGAPPHWGAIPPPMPQPPQQQYAPPPQQQYAPPPQQHQVPPPPQMWGQAPPPPQAAYGQAPPPQAAYYGAPVPAAVSAPPTGPNEVRTLWIGDLQYWMDENYIYGCFASSGEVLSVKLIRDKQTAQLQGYGFIEFVSRAAAERVLQTYNGTMMPNVELPFRLNWASAGEKRDDSPDYTIFVGDLAADVTDYILQETFRVHYPSVKGAKVVTDKLTMRSKGYGFVKFGDPNEQARAMTEMNGMLCSSRPMRIGPAANKKTTGVQEKVPSAQGVQSDNDPNNTTIFVGGLDPNVTEDILRQVFMPYGEVVHVKIPVGKRCGFVQYATRSSAEEALVILQGTLIGGQNVRLSWGRSPSNKQTQPQQDSNQWAGANPGYYGYGQGYEAYGYAQPQSQDPNIYGYGAYTGYPNYQQQPVAQHPQQQQ